jgi:hypothetical protein
MQRALKFATCGAIIYVLIERIAAARLHYAHLLSDASSSARSATEGETTYIRKARLFHSIHLPAC